MERLEMRTLLLSPDWVPIPVILSVFISEVRSSRLPALNIYLLQSGPRLERNRLFCDQHIHNIMLLHYVTICLAMAASTLVK